MSVLLVILLGITSNIRGNWRITSNYHGNMDVGELDVKRIPG